MYQKIMVPLDGSRLAECVVPHVEAFIKGFNVSDIILARVIEPVKPDFRTYDSVLDESFIDEARKIWDNIEEREKTKVKNYLDQLAQHLKEKDTTVHPEILIGDAAKNLADYAESHDIDLIIMASHGYSGIKRWIMGSVAEKLFRSVSVPVFMVRAQQD